MLSRIYIFLLGINLLSSTDPLFAQDSLGNHYLTLSAAFDLAMSHSTEITVAHRSLSAVHEQTLISQQSRLPEANVSLKEGYLSSAEIWSPEWGDHRVGYLPHTATDFSVAASWTIIAGGRIVLAVRQAGIQEEHARLDVIQHQQDVKLFVAVKYLDICRQLNQQQIYLDNAQLARHRLSEIESLHRQGMVTRNDVLRTQIEINDYELAARRTGNAILRLNTELNMILGQADSVRLIPDSNLLHRPAQLQPLAYYLGLALRNNPGIQISRTESRSAALRVRQQKAERLPTISLFGETNLLRPYVYSIPAMDIYYNVWQVGVSIRYDIGSMFRSSARIRGSQLDLDVSRTKDTLDQQQVIVDVRNAYNFCEESNDALQTSQLNVGSANENYRIVEEKYRNQLALITDLIDATDTKIAAEIRVNDAIIDTIYTYYQLLQYTGSL